MTDDPTLAARSAAPRNAALDLIALVLRKGVPFDDAAETHIGLKGLETRDRAFVRLLCATLFRRLGQVDAAITQALSDPGQPPKGAVLDLLRLGAVQLLFLETPPHAAVSTTVALAAQRNQDPYKGLINAVLRRLATEGAAWVAAQDAGRLNTPDWLWLSWRQAYGMGRTRAIVDAHLHEAPLDLRTKGDPAAWVEPLAATLLPTGSLRRAAGGNVADLPGFAEGQWWVQDAAAALAVPLLGNLAGRRVVDLCAAPGGKTAQLAAAGALVTAVDRNPKRLKRLRENLTRLGLDATVVEADAVRWTPETPPDAILLDAPCSATGTIRRHPDVARLKTQEDVAKLVALQRRLLFNAATIVRPGGIVLFCTCSLQPEEGEAQAEVLLARNPDMAREPIRAHEVGGLSALITPDGDVRATPGDLPELGGPELGGPELGGPELGGLDGFYIARFQRRPA